MVFLVLQWRLVDESLRKHLWNSDESDANFIDRFRFYCATFQNIDDSLLLLRWFVEATFTKHWRLRCKYYWALMFWFYCANLRNIDFSLMLQWCFVDPFLREHWWYSDDLDANKNDHLRFFLLVSELLMFHCCFIDDSLMRYWQTMEVSMQTIVIRKNNFVLVFQTLIIQYCFLEVLLMRLWRNFNEALMFSSELWW